MGDTSIAYRQGDYPCAVGNQFAKRVQDVETAPIYPREGVDQLGSATQVGTVAESTDYRFRIRAYGIDNSLESAFGGLTAVAWQNFGGTTVATPVRCLTGCKPTRLEYSCRVGGWFEESIDGFGTASSAGSSAVATTTGDIAFRAKDINVTLNGVASVRLQSFRVTVDLRPNEVREFNNASVVGRVYDSPNLEAELEFLESSSIAGAAEYTSSAGSMVITVDSTKKVVTLNNIRSRETPYSARVRDFGRRVYRYVSDANTADGGITLS